MSFCFAFDFRFCFSVLLLSFGLGVGSATAGVRLSLEDISHPAFSARKLSLEFSGDGQPARLAMERLSLLEHDFGKVSLACARVSLKGTLLACAEGSLLAQGASPLPLAFSVDFNSGAVSLDLKPAPGERWQLAANWRTSALELVLQGARVERVASWLPGVSAYHPKGAVSGSVSLGRSVAGRTVKLKLELAGVSFGDEAGNRAGDKIAGSLELEGVQGKVALRLTALPSPPGGREGRGGEGKGAGDTWSWKISADWREGEAYVAPIYLPAGGVKLAASGSLGQKQLAVDQGRLDMAGVGAISFSGVLDRESRVPQSLRLAGSKLELAKAGELLLAPLLEQAGLPKFKLGGQMDIALDWGEMGLSRLDLAFSGASLADPNQRMVLSGIEAELPWRLTEATKGQVKVAGGSVLRVPLGAFVLPLSMKGWNFSLAKVEVPVFEGALVLDGAQAVREDGHWNWHLGGSVYPISMEKLTRAAGIPVMAGSLSGVIPRVKAYKGTVSLEGQVVIQVFDGYLAAQGVSLSDAFGRVPTLRVQTMAIRNLNLGQLTQTFSFGDITGFLDGDLEGLEVANWQAQRFDARLISSPGDYSRRISQRAVQNISSLGGAGAAAAIQRSFLGFLKTFGYSRIGISCRLRNGVCTMGGVTAAPQGYVLVEGGGIPALSVIGYNPTVDWNELVSRIKDAIANNVRPVIR